MNGHAIVVGNHATVGRLSKKSLTGQAIVVGGHATVGRLSNYFIVSTKMASLEKFSTAR